MAYGTHYYLNGKKYVGIWNNDKKYLGNCYYSNGNYIKVTPYNFEKEKIYFISCDKYIGMTRNSKFNGYGTYNSPDGHKHIGMWKDGLANGYGTNYCPNGHQYIGMWKDGLANGYGTYYYSDGDKYIGMWKDDNRYGYGTYYYSSGNKYVGMWKDGEKCGYGTYYFCNGNKYVGMWKDGEECGYGTYYFCNGDKYVELKTSIKSYDLWLAAVKIQKIVRNFLARNKIIDFCNKVTKIQKIVRGFLVRNKIILFYNYNILLQKIARVFLVRNKLIHYAKNIKIIQKIARGFIVRNILVKSYSPFNKIKKSFNINIQKTIIKDEFKDKTKIQLINIKSNDSYYGNIKVKKPKRYRLEHSKNKINKVSKMDKKKNSPKNNINIKTVKKKNSPKNNINIKTVKKKNPTIKSPNKKLLQKKIDNTKTNIGFIIPPVPILVLPNRSKTLSQIKKYNENKLNYKVLQKVIYDKFKYPNSGKYIHRMDMKKTVYLNFHNLTKNFMRKEIIKTCEIKIDSDEYNFQGIFVNIGRGDHGKLILKQHLFLLHKRWKNEDKFEFKNRLLKLKKNRKISFQLKRSFNC